MEPYSRLRWLTVAISIACTAVIIFTVKYRGDKIERHLATLESRLPDVSVHREELREERAYRRALVDSLQAINARLEWNTVRLNAIFGSATPRHR